MLKYIVTRILGLIGVLFIVSVITFSLMHAIPGGPFDEEKMPLSAEAKANILRKYGLDKPLYEQYGRYMWNAVQFDFGIPFQSPGETVTDLISRTWPISMQLGGMGLAIAFTMGILLGIISAVRQNTWLDYATTAIATLGFTVPPFATSILFIVLFATIYRILPTGGWGGPETWIMPVIVYSLGPMAIIARYTRSSFLENLRSDYVRTARAKGLKEYKVLSVHVMKNSLIPLLTIMGPMLPGVLTGSLFVEGIFRIPGLGQFFVTSIFERDYPMIMALTLLVAVLIGITYLITDILYMLVDPRVRYERGVK
ncbi:MAG: ABC transporter permease [Candidatus Latescibacteria bacterium]|jgi:peptide/nickel transport system permease protein|nr:ABC transporter permease [Candidatus Latescibacterota bacterium]